jgi:hypothetical protein
MTAAIVSAVVALGAVGAPAATAAEPATGTITVMLMTPPKEPLPLVNVGIVMTNEFGATRTGLTNLEGELTLENVPVGSHWSIAATPQLVAGRWGRLAGVRWGVTVEAGQHDWVVVVLRYGGSITGGVTTSAGIPARNAQVTAVGGWSNKTYRTSTDNSGRYSLGSLPSGGYTVTYGSKTLGFATTTADITAQYSNNPWSVLTGVDVVLAPPVP